MRIYEYWCPKISDTQRGTLEALTAGKARYRAWLSIRECWDSINITDVKVRSTGTVARTLPTAEDLGITQEQWDILHHALGGSHKGAKLGFRDYFFTEIDDPNCCALVDAGLLCPGAVSRDSHRYWHVTVKGMRLFGVDPEVGE